MEERWITKENILKFLNKLNNLAETNNKQIDLYLFGGCALVMHGLRERTSDFDSIMLVNGKVNSEFFNNIKLDCLTSIGVNESHPLFNDTFNDLSKLPEASQKRGIEHLNVNYDRFEFKKIKIGNLSLMIPSKKYLLMSRLFDLITDKPKTSLDIIDAVNLINDLGINKDNKEEFFKTLNHPKKNEIMPVLDNILDKIEQTAKVSEQIDKIRERFINNNTLRNNMPK
jgi:hypothetical protein